jgi:Domain of unknown function (DUF1648)
VRIPQIALVVALAVASLALAYFYPQLPPVVASHFNAAGDANSWQSKQAFAGTFCFVYLLFATVNLVLPHLIMSLPAELINLPNKGYWLAPERRLHTAHVVGDQLAWLGAGQIIVVALVGQLAINANLPGGDGRLGPAAIWFVVAFVFFVVLWLIRFFRTFARASG